MPILITILLIIMMMMLMLLLLLMMMMMMINNNDKLRQDHSYISSQDLKTWVQSNLAELKKAPK